jgi:hypothetical protein
MAELVMALVRTREDVVSALKMKSMLWDRGIELSGIVVGEEDSGIIPPVFLEDMVQLKIVGYLNQRLF